MLSAEFYSLVNCIIIISLFLGYTAPLFNSSKTKACFCVPYCNIIFSQPHLLLIGYLLSLMKSICRLFIILTPRRVTPMMQL